MYNGNVTLSDNEGSIVNEYDKNIVSNLIINTRENLHLEIEYQICRLSIYLYIMTIMKNPLYDHSHIVTHNGSSRPLLSHNIVKMM